MKIKYRIVGIMVLAALAVIILAFISSGADQSIKKTTLSTNIPKAPAKPKVNLKLPTENMHKTVRIVEKHPAEVYIGGATKPSNKTTKSVVQRQAPKKVTKQTRGTTSRIKRGWTVQVASFGTKVNADKLQQLLRRRGFPAYVETARMNNGKTLNRVFVGPEIEKAEARKLQTVLRNQFKLNGVVVQYRV